MRTLLDKGPAVAAIAIFVVFMIASVIITGNSYTLPKPADWLEAWFKLFQSAVAIVVGLKIAWNIDSIVSVLTRRAPNSAAGD